MAKRVARPGVRQGYDTWSEKYDATPNPLVSLDRRHTVRALKPRPRERVLDAGCGTGVHLLAMSGAGSRPVGVDFSIGMLRVARRAAPGVPLVQADLNQRFPVREGAFDAVLTALVSEHLTDLGLFFREAFVSLRAGGRLVFSAFHPELALSGVEANFEHDGTEYRLGAELHTVDDYLNRIVEAGFREPRLSEYRGDATLARTVPGGVKYEGRAVLLLIEATRPL